MSEFEDIEREYEYGGKREKTSVRFFPDKSIASVTEISEDMKEIKVLSEGMSKEEIEKYFPPDQSHATMGCTYDRAKMIRSIIYEAYRKEGEIIEEGNVRNFWYTHLKKIITEELGLNEIDVATTINTAWGDVINSGLVTYEGMNITGGKEQARISIVKDSPFANLIIAVEKADFLNFFKWIALLFNCTVISAAGQPSRASARAFIKQLKDLNVDLNQQFYMCVISDLDPAGYYIQEAFRKQFEAAIKFYGGTGQVKIVRLFVRKDQVSAELLKSEAMPCRDKTKTEKAIKAEDTKWDYFCEQTDGGIYIPAPSGWTGPIYDIDKKTGEFKKIEIKEKEKKLSDYSVRALLEMNAFGKSLIEKAIIKELLKIIEETSDETKILIPEIMRVFEEIRKDVGDDIYEQWKKTLIDPLKKKFLKDTDEWEEFIDDKEETDKDEINDEYDKLVEKKEEEKRERVPELFNKKEELENTIESLEEERDKKIEEIEEEYTKQLEEPRNECEDVEAEIDEKCKDLDEKIDKLNEEKDEKLENIDEQYNFRMEKYNKFKEDHSAVFNPVEQALKSDIASRISQDNLPYFFKDLENRDETRLHISDLCITPKLLLDKNISCFDHPAPAFKGEKYLEQAAENKDLNVGKVRDSFSTGFLEDMKDVISSDCQDLTFELSKTVEMKDLSQEVKEAMEETEKEIE